MTTVTLDLPLRIYRKAAEAAKATKRPIEQVVVEWIQPPGNEPEAASQVVLKGLETMNTAQLIEIAQAKSAPAEVVRLRELLRLQEQRELTQSEFTEAARLVEQEDLLTLRKAKAIYVLKQRAALPPPVDA